MNDFETVRESQPVTPHVTLVEAIGIDTLRRLLAEFRLGVTAVALDAPIPGSFWGDAEAGLQGGTLLVRVDTPLHSALHEAGHYVCMDPKRRAVLDTDAGGGYDEENAVCYWQIMACDRIEGVDRDTMCADMDAWGYTFRLGSAAAWFADDAEDARAWLIGAGLLDDVHDRLLPGVRIR
ncbi:MAG: hypothetical protein WBL23_08420 [Salinisphaera sp.]|uniref:hypothetical protein n=1 Tax=Salinisphaera sp. TaxID=1914330 RepID=UPI003C7C5F7E